MSSPTRDPNVTDTTRTQDTAAAESADPATFTDFGIDTTAMSTSEAIRDYFARLRAGELGSLPALLGLAALVVVFAASSEFFLSLNNIANLLAQGAGQTIIAMGIVFVLLVGEIDLSAGTASGVAAAVMALHFVEGGNLLGGMGVINFAVFLGVLGLATLLAVLLRIWVGAALSTLAIVIVAGGFVVNPWVEMLLAVCVGTAIGCITGFLVSKIGMPSFVVTLALFLAWTGVILEIIGGRGVLGFRSSEVLYGVANSNLSTLGSWVLFVVGAGGFAAVTFGRHFSRLRRGLVAQPTPIVVAKVLAVAALGVAATAALTVDRSPNPQVVITGVPYVVPIILALLTVGTYVLNRTQYGRHIYAVGGNKEAARRAGINVTKIKASVFVVCSSTAALGAIVYTSKVGSVDPQAGGLNTLLFAVGAAVIGGTSLFGGRGRVFDAVIGGTVLAVINNGLGLLGQPASVVSIITGLVLLLAATVDALSRKRAAVAPR